MNQKPQAANAGRAGPVERVVHDCSRRPRYSGEPDYEADVTDLLTDLRHFCVGAGLDFNRLSETAKRHYEAEKNDDVNRCADCERLWLTDELERVEDFWDRVDPGQTMPSGQCPDCGALCHRQFRKDGRMRIVAEHQQQGRKEDE